MSICINFLSIILLLFLQINISLSQGCIISKECEDKSFNYMYCDGTKKVFKCSSNPYFTFKDINGDTLLRPLKIKPCFDYVTESFTVEQFTH